MDTLAIETLTRNYHYSLLELAHATLLFQEHQKQMEQARKKVEELNRLLLDLKPIEKGVAEKALIQLMLDHLPTGANQLDMLITA
jgi:hypothetical protein